MGMFGLFGSESKSTSSDERIAATDSAIALRDSGQINSATDGAVASGQNNNVAGLGSIALSNVSGNVTLGDMGALREITSQYNQTLSEFIDANKSTNSASQSVWNKVLDNLTQLAENKQTDGENLRNQNVLWIALAALGVFALFLIYKR